jgi:hypothetical protein
VPNGAAQAADSAPSSAAATPAAGHKSGGAGGRGFGAPGSTPFPKPGGTNLPPPLDRLSPANNASAAPTPEGTPRPMAFAFTPMASPAPGGEHAGVCGGACVWGGMGG